MASIILQYTDIAELLHIQESNLNVKILTHKMKNGGGKIGYNLALFGALASEIAPINGQSLEIGASF